MTDPHPVTACTDPHLLCPIHDRPFFPRHDFQKEPDMARETNPETGSQIETEENGDFTVTFSMGLPTPPPPADDES